MKRRHPVRRAALAGDLAPVVAGIALATIILAGFLAPAVSGDAAAPRGPQAATAAWNLSTVDPRFLAALEWRSIGPFRGGGFRRSAAIPTTQPCSTWGRRTAGCGRRPTQECTWRNVSDPFFKAAPVGALDVSASSRDTVYVGTGEGIARQHVTAGDGVYKSTDGGRTWTNVGLRETRHIARLRIHPTNPDIVFVAALGDMFGTNAERGIFRTKDGGKTWQKVLYKSDRAGAFDIAMAPSNPNVLFASLDQFQRFPWDEMSGGPDSGLYKTTDGGDTWTEITRNPGLPKGVIGKIGLAISPPRPERVYAIIEAADGGVFRSDDGGATWQRVSNERAQRPEASCYLHITADTKDADTVYVQHVEVWKSTDGGQTFRPIPMQHSDHHAMWIDPKNPNRMIDGSDGGASVTLNGGATWSSLDNQPTADLFGLAVDDQDPYWVYAAQNDNSHIGIPSRTGFGAISWPALLDIEGGEGGQTAVKPDGSVVYACDRTAIVRFDRRTGQTPDISVWPEDEFGTPGKDVKNRFYYSFPILLSPHDPGVLYTAAQRVFRTTNEGASWEAVSPDLTRNRVDKMQAIPGMPITTRQSSLFYVSLIRTVAESPIHQGELWIGTDDSTVQVTRNGGKTWDNISPPDFPEWTTITAIDVSRHDRGTAYLAAERHRMSDRAPYLYKTTDYGRTWRKISKGIRENDFTYVIREDPVRKGLLFAGTETGAYVSFDAGESWQSLQRNLPPVAVAYMQVKNADLVVATHGRGFWIMDNIAALRQITPEVTAAPAHLFQVSPTIRRLGGGRTGRGPRPGVQYGGAGGMVVAFEERRDLDGRTRRGYLNAGQNPASGVAIEYSLTQMPSGEVALAILDSKGEVIQRFSSQAKDARGLPAELGINRFLWDMRYPGARDPAPSDGAMYIEAGRPPAPLAPPGRYAARLTVGGQMFEQPFEIRRDSRVSATDADLQAQFELMVKIRDRVSEVADALTRLRAARRELDDLVKPGSAAPDAGQARQQLRAIEGQLVRLMNAHPLDMAPKGLSNKLAALAGDVGRGDARPTRQMYAVFEDLSARVAVQVEALNAAIRPAPRR